jgi:hypothetical protein
MKKKKVKNIATYYKAEGTPIFRDTTALPFLTGGPLVDKTNHGKLLPSLYASSPGNYYAEGGQMIPPDCGPGQYYDEALGQCVPIKKPIIVESIDDPIYQDYLIRKQLYEHSQVPNYEQRDLATYALRNDPNRLFNYQKFLENNKDVINDPESPEYLDDTKGPYGSAAFKQRMTPKEFADFQKINNPRLSGYQTRINELTAKYPPAGYEIYTKETDSPYQYGIARNSGNWTIPNTAFLEDKINRDRLRQTYPALTDAEIDSWVLESRTTPEYISNTRNTEGNYNWLSGPGSEQTITSEDGSTSTEFVSIKYPDFNPPISFRDPDTGQIGYYPDEILAYNKKLNYYLPYWNEPEPVRLKPIKMELRKPEPISINTKKLAGTPEENLPPSYPIPFTGMEWHDDYKTRINWGHKDVEYHLPKFRKPGHGGDLIKKGKSRYIHLPTLEKYNEAYLAPRDSYTIRDKLIRKFSGYNPEEMEGYQGGDAYYPGEIERAQEEGRRIEFQGYRNKADKALQEEYNRAYDKYEAQKGYEDMILQMSQKGINPFAYKTGGMLKRADGSYSKRGLWDNIRANAGSGKKPTKEMLAQERKINREYRTGGQFPRPYSLPEDSFKQGGNNLHNSIYASSPAQYPAIYGNGGGMSSHFYASNVPDNNISNKDLTYPENSYVYRLGGRLIKKFK